MDVRNCKNCGRLFNYLSGPSICPACKEEVEDKFQTVKEYVRDNPGATIQMVSEENDVSVKQIRQWVREERLEFSPNSLVGIECEGCGAMIRTGRFCDSCKTRLRQDFNKAAGKGNSPYKEDAFERALREKDKMRFLK